MISTMDAYYINKEDFDSLLELGVGKQDKEQVLGKISSVVKSGFTKQYNKGTHAIRLMSEFKAEKKGKVEKADFEEVLDFEEEEEEEDMNSDKEDIMKGDKLIKKKNKKTK